MSGIAVEGETWWDVYHLPTANLVGDYATRREARAAVREMVASGAPRRHFRIAQWRLVKGNAVNVRSAA